MTVLVCHNNGLLGDYFLKLIITGFRLNEDAAYKRAVTGQNGDRKLLSHS